MNKESLRTLLFKERGHACEECGKGNAVQINHWLVHDMKRFHDILTEPWNCGMVCVMCHNTGRCHSTESKERFAQRQLQRGYDLGACYRDLPMKVTRQKYW